MQLKKYIDFIFRAQELECDEKKFYKTPCDINTNCMVLALT